MRHGGKYEALFCILTRAAHVAILHGDGERGCEAVGKRTEAGRMQATGWHDCSALPELTLPTAVGNSLGSKPAAARTPFRGLRSPVSTKTEQQTRSAGSLCRSARCNKRKYQPTARWATRCMWVKDERCQVSQRGGNKNVFDCSQNNICLWTRDKTHWRRIGVVAKTSLAPRPRHQVRSSRLESVEMETRPRLCTSTSNTSNILKHFQKQEAVIIKPQRRRVRPSTRPSPRTTAPGWMTTRTPSPLPPSTW